MSSSSNLGLDFTVAGRPDPVNAVYCLLAGGPIFFERESRWQIMSNTIQTCQQPKWLFNQQGPSGTGPGIAGAVAFLPAGLANGQGMKSDVLDLGGGVRNNLFEWRARTAVVGTPTLGGTVEFYLATSDDNSNWDGNLGSGSYPVTNADKRRNLQYLGSVSVDDMAGTGTPYITSGFCQTYARYISLLWFNFAGSTLSGNMSDHLFQLTPVPDQIEPY